MNQENGAGVAADVIDVAPDSAVAGTGVAFATGSDLCGDLEELVAAYRNVTMQIDSLTAAKKVLAEQIERALQATGQTTVDTAAGKVYYVEGRTSVRYDAAKLDELCESSGWWKQMLESFRTVSQSAGYVAVKVKK